MSKASRKVETLSFDEKISIALGEVGDVDGLPAFVYTDGPNGVRGANGATALPSALVLAATFDRDRAAQYGQVLGSEVRAAGKNVLLGPAVDILRVPWAGRSGESFGEDPVLAGILGGAVVSSVQSQGVLAVVKHFVANNFEFHRTGEGSFSRRTHGADVRVGQRALREVYLEPFRRLVRDYGAAALMTSYNRLNGSYVAEDTDMLDLPRSEWGFSGATFPDFLFAVRDASAALHAGLDIPGLDGPSGREREIVSALSSSALDAIANHVLSAIRSVELVEPCGDPQNLGKTSSLDVALRVAEDGAVLLANTGLLPLKTKSRIALVCPPDLSHLAVIGGSASVEWPVDRVSSLCNELTAAGFDVVAVDSNVADVAEAALGPTLFEGDVVAKVKNSITDEARTVILKGAELFDVPEWAGDEWQATVDARFIAPGPGIYRLTVDFAGDLSVAVDGATVEGFREASPMLSGPAYPLHCLFEAGAGAVEISLRYATGAALNVAELGLRPGFRFGVVEVGEGLARAALAAANADAAVVVVGRATGEAMDADSLRLPAGQEELIARVAAANANTVVVTGGSGPIVMPWAHDVAAILHMGQAGESFASAAANILTGNAEPGGRLPFTIPAMQGDVPLQGRGYPGSNDIVEYSEGLGVGYRGYERSGTKPAFHFGHGLTYTEFDVAEAELRVGSSDAVFSALILNTGSRAGKCVVQLYTTAVDRPGDLAALRGFTSTRIESGAKQHVRITVPISDFQTYDETLGAWVLPRSLRVSCGMSRGDLRWSEDIELPSRGSFATHR